MENRKNIPHIQTTFKNLRGFLIGNGLKANIIGKLFYKNKQPVFIGKVASPIFDIAPSPSYKIKLTDQNGHDIICERSWIKGYRNFTIFDFLIDKTIIKKGNIKDTDDVEIFCILQIKPFCGSEMSHNNIRCINKLDFVAPGSRLYSSPIAQVNNGNGYLFFSMKFSDFAAQEDNFIKKFYYLLSFATGNYIGFPYLIIWKDEDNYIIKLSPSSSPSEGSGIFYITYPDVIQNFLSNAWASWDYHINQIDLPSLIDYYILMQNQKYIDVKLLLGSVLMEAIKHQYASNIRNYSKDRHGFFINPSNNQRFTFRELVNEIYAYYNVQSGDLTFINFRNEVIHQGKINLSIPNKLNQFNLLAFSIEQIFLNIFNHKGTIWDRFQEKWMEYS